MSQVAGRGELDPRILPVGTTLRFALMVLAMIAASHHMLDVMLGAWAEDDARQACWFAAGLDPEGTVLEQLGVGRDAEAALQACLSASAPPRWWPVPLAMTVLLVSALALYLWLPRRAARRRRLLSPERLDPTGGLRLDLDRLVRRAGLRSVPDFAVDPGRLSAGAVVLGHARRRTVCLYAGLLVAREKDPAMFEAVVLHELAHIRNRDVELGYAVTALWRVFCVLVTLPFLLVYGGSLVAAEFGLFVGADAVFWPAQRAPMVRAVIGAVGLAVLVALARADTLRHRELHADADAVGLGADRRVWTGARDARGGTARGVNGLWAAHPTWSQRRRSLDDPLLLFSLAPLQVALLGAAAMTTGHQLGAVLDSTVATWLAAAPTALLLALAAWRSVAYAEHRGGAGSGGLRAGAALGAGLAVGDLLAGITGGTGWLPEHPWVLLVPVCGALAFTPWLVQCARLGWRSARGGTGRNVAAAGCAAAAVLVAVAGMTWWLGGGNLYAAGDSFGRHGVRRLLTEMFPGEWSAHGAELDWIAAVMPRLGVDGNSLVFVVAGAALWAVPALLWAVGPPGARAGLRRSLLHGLAGGALCTAGLLLVKAGLYGQRPGYGLRGQGFALLYVWWLTVAVWAGGVVTAVVTAVVGVVRRERLWLARALVAAGSAQALALAAQFLLGAVDGCLGPLRTMADGCHWVPDGSWPLLSVLAGPVLPALFGAAMAAALAGAACTVLLRRSRGRGADGARERPVAADAGRRSARGRAGAAALALGCAAAVLLGPAALLSLPAGGGTSSALTFGRPPDARSERVRVFQIVMWFGVAGKADIAAVTDAYEDFSTEIDRLAGRAPDGSGGTVALDVPRMRSICSALDRATTTALGHLAVPDAGLGRPWREALRRGQGAARACVALMDRDGEVRPAEADAVLAGLYEGYGETAAALRPLVERIGTDGPRYWPALFLDGKAG
ncbi:hypothetical protein DEJ45_11930 [Streptomyces venezuelae]|nr:hypothetical protein DEJ45_11930 [Streptomyces venezuelae]